MIQSLLGFFLMLIAIKVGNEGLDRDSEFLAVMVAFPLFVFGIFLLVWH